ncbi:VOC family protein [Microbacterium sp. CIAB417]|uniref:VOC family protein n=1 Tax=Microbacterium sp. CIAB417 TaxID=2860287 RepID=UPI001FAE0858|nr:VOC family protein [Microbacterium sp. CIAB417]
MRNPLQDIGQVFIPVSDIVVSAAWYARLLGVEASPPSHEDTIVDLPTPSGPRLALDATAPFTADGPPRFFWWTEDLEQVVQHLEDLEVTIAAGPVNIGSVSFVQFRDPDGSLLMACVRNP